MTKLSVVGLLLIVAIIIGVGVYLFMQNKDEKLDKDTTTSTGNPPPPIIVTTVKNVSVTNTTISLTWNDVKNVTIYILKIKRVTSDTYTNFTSTSSAYTFTNLIPNTAYTIQCIPVVNNIEQPPSTLVQTINTWSVPGVVSDVTSIPTFNSIQLAFVAAPYATTYTFKIKSPTDSVWRIDSSMKATGRNIQKMFEHLEPNTLYSFQIIASDDNNQVGQVVEILNIRTSVFDEDTTLGTVRNLQVAEKSLTSYKLTWNSPANDIATNYKVTWIDHETDESQSFSFVGPTNRNDLVQYTVSDCLSGHTYRTIISGFNGTFGLEATIDVIVPSLPNDVKNLVTTLPLGIHTIPLRWSVESITELRNITSFVINYRLHGNHPWISWSNNPINVSEFETSTIFTATLDGLLEATTYDIKVLAKNSYGLSSGDDYSILNSVSTINRPSPPTNITVLPISLTGVNLSWTSLDNSYTYNYKYSKSDDSSDIPQTGTTNQTNVAINQLVSGVWYVFNVQTIDNATLALSDWSNGVTILAGAPGPITNLRDLSSGRYTCVDDEYVATNRWEWNPVVNATVYYLMFDGFSNGYTGTETSVIATNPVWVEPGYVYGIHLIASNQYGRSTQTISGYYQLTFDCY